METNKYIQVIYLSKIGVNMTTIYIFMPFIYIFVLKDNFAKALHYNKLISILVIILWKLVNDLNISFIPILTVTLKYSIKLHDVNLIFLIF
jgi:hypothetical protein